MRLFIVSMLFEKDRIEANADTTIAMTIGSATVMLGWFRSTNSILRLKPRK